MFENLRFLLSKFSYFTLRPKVERQMFDKLTVLKSNFSYLTTV